MNRYQMAKYGKLVLGTVLAIYITNSLSLKYTYSAGIITLLTIQDTKRETISITGKRLFIFVAMTFLSMLIFPITGYTLQGFGVILIPYLLICMLLDMKEAIAPIAVLCTHYISEGSCSYGMIRNEFLLLLIGAGIGIIMNLFFQDTKMLIQRKQEAIDNKMRMILSRMADMISGKESMGSDDDAFFSEIDAMLEDLKSEALHYINNHFLSGNDYYYNYVLMRNRQCRLLKQIYRDIIRLNMVPEQAEIVADFFRETAEVFHEKNNVAVLLRHLDKLNDYFAEDDLPKTRKEFENRALLYHILEDMKRLVEMKRQFYLNYQK